MKLSPLLPAIVALGLVLIVLAFVWPLAVGTESSWSMDDYQEYQAALAKGHEISHEFEHVSSDSLDKLKQKDKEARLNIERLNAKLAKARDGQQNVVWALKWSGIVLTLVGTMGIYAKRSAGN